MAFPTLFFLKATAWHIRNVRPVIEARNMSDVSLALGVAVVLT